MPVCNYKFPYIQYRVFHGYVLCQFLCFKFHRCLLAKFLHFKFHGSFKDFILDHKKGLD